MCEDSIELATIAVEEGAVQSLIVVLSNVRHPPSQKHSARTLSHLVRMFVEVHDTLKECLGPELLEEFLKAPEEIHKKLTPTQLDKLISTNPQVILPQSSSDDESLELLAQQTQAI